MKTSNKDQKYFQQIIETSYNKAAWHGPNLSSSLKGVQAEMAAWRPAPGRHNIWELTVHAAYWKYIVAKRISGSKENDFPFKGRNWFISPDNFNEYEWQKVKKLLSGMHKLLLGKAGEIKPADLFKPAKGSNTKTATLIQGIAFHDIYHAGQIQLLKKLFTGRPAVSAGTPMVDESPGVKF